MPLLQRYILGELLRVFGFALSVLTILVVPVGIFKEIADKGLGPSQVLPILPYVVPSLLPFTIPATFLLTVTVVYGRLSGDREITAAKAAGINVLSLLFPSFFLGAVLSVCSLFLTDQVIPWATGKIERTIALAIEDIFLDRLRTHNVISLDEHGINGVELTVMGVEGKRLIRPMFSYTPKKKGRAVMINAREAMLKFDLERDQVVLHLVDVEIDNGEWKVTRASHQEVFPLEEIRKDNPRYMPVRQIRHELKKVEAEREELEERRVIESVMTLSLGEFDRMLGRDFRTYNKGIINQDRRFWKLQTEMHSRFSLSSSCFFFVLLGSPFAILQSRRQFLTTFFMCFMPILLLYYPVVLLMLNLSKTNTVNPVWGTWAGNSIMLSAAGVAIWKVLRH